MSANSKVELQTFDSPETKYPRLNGCHCNRKERRINKVCEKRKPLTIPAMPRGGDEHRGSQGIGEAIGSRRKGF